MTAAPAAIFEAVAAPGDGFAECCAKSTTGAVTPAPTAPAVTPAAPPFASIAAAPADPPPPTSSPMRCASDGAEGRAAAVATHLATGAGVTAVAAARRV